MKYGFPLVLLFLCLSFALAQSTNATLSGGVTDPFGNFIVNAEVVIANDLTGVVYSARTNNEGMYIVPILPPAHYHVQVSKPGFKTIIKADVVLNVQSALALNFTLPVGATSESVTVDSASALINTTSASVSTVIDSKFVENTPLNGRSFQDLISMTPGVVTQSPQANSQIGRAGDFSINGQRTESNYYMVDGVSANLDAGTGNGGSGGSSANGTTPGATALGTTQSLMSVDALQEFRVQSSTYSAEYGHAPGGQISLVTRSGTNQVHGTAFNYLRNSAFDANDWFNNEYEKPATALRQNDFGGTIGGPVEIPRLYKGTKRSFFFVSYEGLRLTQPQPATVQYVPDTYMRAEAAPALQPLLYSYPLQNGIDYGTASNPSLAQFIKPYSLPSSIDSTSLRLDHTVGSKLSVFFRMAITPSVTRARSLSVVTSTISNTKNYTIGATNQLSTVMTNEFRAGYIQADSKLSGYVDTFGGSSPIDLPGAMGIGGFSDPEAIFILYSPGIGLANLAEAKSQNRSRQWNIVDTLDIQKQRHQVKLGIESRGMKFILAPESPLLETEYLTNASLINNESNLFFLAKATAATPRFNDWSAFLQDEWRISERINASLGLRWELAPPPTEEHGNDAYTVLGSVADPSSLVLAPQGTPLWQSYKYNLAPRIGLAWKIHRSPGRETVLRAGGGAFFDTANESATLGYGGVGFYQTQLTAGSPLPAVPSQLAFTPSAAPPYTNKTVYAFPAHLQLPYTLQWNVSLQQALREAQSLTISYVASSGRRLVGWEELNLKSFNPNFGPVITFPSNLTSNYQGLQVQFQRSVSHGLQALVSYTWSHSLDFGSNYEALPLTRGNSDFDARHNLSGGVTWTLPTPATSSVLNAIAANWGIDGRLVAHTSFPVTLSGNLVTDPTNGSEYYGGMNLLAGKPIYLYGAQCPTLAQSRCPGGRVVNSAAFQAAPSGEVGDAPRNFVRGFGDAQVNFAVRRDFPIHENTRLQFRAESFNLLNHPNFGYVDPYLTDATFGQATKMLNQSLGTVASQYQQGGPRSMQLALRFLF